ncbi:hypothetical protein SAM23877_4276 [Streptomyces ambofaciens ATCC 23877]|uniref:Uncharacterized protein n=1 Tax=Streptomyces ambofaciens (strain ATCC 23877 / 3486 / DSM 40053 / JCM 4204 / NBRC 12836 / NRRL B-2516) TaxID=278992 RepID=A0A0K2AWP1_STRA7|nr:hypothetical protein SAM23877_4276 [Streptomyces ambofaciens ATCC 23877]
MWAEKIHFVYCGRESVCAFRLNLDPRQQVLLQPERSVSVGTRRTWRVWQAGGGHSPVVLATSAPYVS